MVIRARWTAAVRALLSTVLAVSLMPVSVAPANTLLPGPPLSVGQSPKYVAIGDVNSDGLIDIGTANYGGHSFTILYQQPGRTFAPAVETPVAGGRSAPGSIAIVDWLRDTPGSEVIVGDTLTHMLYVYRPNIGGGFDLVQTLPAYLNGLTVAAAGPSAPAFDISLGSVDLDGNLGLLAPLFYATRPVDTDFGGFMVFRRLQRATGAVVPPRMLTTSQDGYIGLWDDNNRVRPQTIRMQRDSNLWSVWSDSSYLVDSELDVGPLRTLDGSRDGVTVFGVTSRNYLVHTRNGGATWNLASRVATPAIYGLAKDTEGGAFFIGRTRAMFGYVEDSGALRTAADSVPIFYTPADVTSPRPGVGVWCGDNGAVIEYDQSVSNYRVLSEGAIGDLSAIDSSPDGDTIVSVGNQAAVLVLKYSGGNWSHTAIPTPSGSFNDVAFASTSTVVAVGNGGLLARSIDGGSTWSTVPTPAGTRDLTSVTFLSAQRGAASAADGTVYVTNDGGATWTAVAILQDQVDTQFRALESNPRNPFTSAIGDVNGDGWPDYGVAGFTSGNLLPFYLGGRGGASVPIAFSLPRTPSQIRDITVGDVNGDGLNDVVSAAYEEGDICISYQNSIGRLSDVVDATTFASGDDPSPAPVSLALGDLDGDRLRNNDLVVANSYNLGDSAHLRSQGSVGLFQQRLDGGLRFLGDIDVGRQPSSVAVGQVFTGEANDPPSPNDPREAVIANARDNTVQILRYALPNPPKIVSSSHPTTGTYYSSRFFTALLQPPADFNGVEGFFYSLNKSPSASFSPTWNFTSSTSLNVDITATAGELATSAEGQWYLHAVTRDIVGNTGSSVATYPFRVDLTAPTTPVPDDGVATYTANPRRVFTWPASTDALSGVAYYLVSVDASSEAPADLAAVETSITTTQFTVDGLTDGEHTFRVRAQDRAGNYSLVGLHKAYVDAVAPVVTANEPPNPVGVSPTFNVTATDGAGVTRLRLLVDGTPLFDRAVSGRSVTATFTPNLATFSAGPHTLTIEAYDLLGHVGRFTRTIALDKSGLQPLIFSTSHPDENAFGSSYVFKGSIVSPADVSTGEGFYYVVDRNPNTVPTAASDYTATGSLLINLGGVADELGDPSVEGTWTLHAVIRDKSGVAGTAVAHRQILVDTIAPSGVTPDDGVASWSTSPRRVFRWSPATDSLSGVARYWVSVDARSDSATDLAAVETSQNVTKFTADGLSDGVHVFRVRAQDKAGNYGPVGTHFAYVDANPPSLILGAMGGTVSAKPKFPFIARDGAGLTKVSVKVDDVTVQTRTLTGTSVVATLTPDLSRFANGAHTLTFTLQDRLGHTTSVHRTVVLDKTAPTARVSGSAAKRTVTVKAVKITQSGTMQVTIDGKRVKNVAVRSGSSYTVRYTVPGRLSGPQTRAVRWSVKLTDGVGNSRTYSGSSRVKYFDLVRIGPDTVQVVYY